MKQLNKLNNISKHLVSQNKDYVSTSFKNIDKDWTHIKTRLKLDWTILAKIDNWTETKLIKTRLELAKTRLTKIATRLELKSN